VCVCVTLVFMFVVVFEVMLFCCVQINRMYIALG